MENSIRDNVAQHEADTVTGIACGLVTPNVRRQIEEALLSAHGVEQVRQVLEVAGAGKRREACEILARCRQSGIRVVSRLSSDYPELLRRTSAPPSAIYIRSNCAGDSSTGDLFSFLGVAVVGARSASVTQCEVVKNLASDLASHGVTVVSGLALGIDGAAHRGVLQSAHPSRTVAVLAHGLDMVYPPSHTRLAERIVDAGGVVLSEYPPGVEARKHHFLERNRIIAGLVRGVVVSQAGERSGSLVTARFAADYGRDVFVVLADPCEGDHQAGGIKLAEEGAQVVTCAGDVLREYGIATSDVGLAGLQQHSLADFAALHSLSAAELLALELEGAIVRLPGGRVLVSGAFLRGKGEGRVLK